MPLPINAASNLSIPTPRAEPKTPEPIAIVGMSCRLPGAADLGSFWKLLLDGEDGIEANEAPRLSTPIPAVPEKPSHAARLPDVDRFDAEFFGFTEHETVRMSPAHRLLFEMVWDAIEDSGTPVEALASTRTSVLTSCVLAAEYWNELVARGMHDLYAVTGAALYGTAAGRVAHALDLRGPAMAVDAACTGSLLAVHLACASIRSGESEAAIVGGVNLQMGTAFSSALARVMSPQRRCRFGDGGANGYVRSDGGLAVLLKPLSTAVANGDRIYATLLGSGASSGGRAAHSIVAPSVPGQVAAIVAAHVEAGISAADVDYVEAHGTGTAKGDVAELTALDEVFRPARATNDPCLVGSAKSNVGHTEAAAGLVGLVKTALALHHGMIPPSIHVENPNPILAVTPQVELVREPRPWPVRGGHRIAGVSAFGMSGTNVHVVLAEAPRARPRPAPAASEPELLVLPLSARSPRALTELADAYAGVVEQAVAGDLPDIVHSAGARRTHYEHRAAVLGTSREQFGTGLAALAAGRPSDRVLTGTITTPPRVVFVCAGSGPRWHGLGRSLLDIPAFRQRVAECDSALSAHLGWSVADRLAGDADACAELPVRWAAQIGLAAVWRAWGVEPDVVIGHGSGRLAAASMRCRQPIREAAAIVARCLPVSDDDAENSLVFGDVARSAAAGRRTLFVELGPDSLITTVIRDAAADADLVTSLRAGEPAVPAMRSALAAAYVHGAGVGWAAVHPGRYVPLPGYPWQRRRYWLDGDERDDVRTPGLMAAGACS